MKSCLLYYYYTYSDGHHDGGQSERNDVRVDVVSSVQYNRFVNYQRNKHSEKHANVYGQIKRAEEYAY